MAPLAAIAFAPAVISNFFSVHIEALASDPSDFSSAGATGGGFTLSKGVYTHARATRGGRPALSITVNGDPRYPARTTRKAVELLLERADPPPRSIQLVQSVEVPIGSGFGSSSASALSAAMAVASALGLGMSKEEVASFAHAADIICGTGLGTVSSTYDHAGAGLIVRPGGPGVARVVPVKVPPGLRVVTATLPRTLERGVLASPRMRARTNALGDAALTSASDLSFDSLLAAGSAFAQGLGLMSREVSRLIRSSLEAGALGASQNMLGDAMHAVVRTEDVGSVSSALRSEATAARVDCFRIGGRRARIVRGSARGFLDAQAYNSSLQQH